MVCDDGREHLVTQLGCFFRGQSAWSFERCVGLGICIHKQWDGRCRCGSWLIYILLCVCVLLFAWFIFFVVVLFLLLPFTPQCQDYCCYITIHRHINSETSFYCCYYRHRLVREYFKGKYVAAALFCHALRLKRTDREIHAVTMRTNQEVRCVVTANR